MGGSLDLNVAIIGCGIIGKKRARALGEHNLIVASDINLERAKAVACIKDGAIFCSDWKYALATPEIDIIIIATTNDNLAKIALESVKAGKHVLVEKPGARYAYELEPVIKVAESTKVFVKVGFNLRYHPGFLKAREIIDSGKLGPLMFIRGRYGHGGRIGYDKEWRAIPDIAGGGELLDQGVHLIDLSRWFLGEFSKIEGFTHTYYWNMPLEDNGFMMLKTKSQQVAWLHVSCTEWKNLFSYEIYGRDGKLSIDGLGGSYGIERITFFKMLPEMGPPETIIWEYPFPDNSWKKEFDYFVDCIKNERNPQGNLYDAKAALEIVQKMYGRKH